MLGANRTRSVGFAHDMNVRIPPNLDGYMADFVGYGLLQRQLIPSPVRRGKVRMGVALWV